MLEIRATEAQMKEVAINAIKASSPMGMGHFHFDPGEKFEPSMIEIRDGGNPGIFLDYVGGRMVKLQIWRKGHFEWQMHDGSPRSDYQSWCHKYPTYESLAKSVPGVEVVEPKPKEAARGE